MNNENEQESLNNNDYFKKQMLKAFKHGINFKLKDSDKDINLETCLDENLPFHEWFNKYYNNQVIREVYKISTFIFMNENELDNFKESCLPRSKNFIGWEIIKYYDVIILPNNGFKITIELLRCE